MSARGPGRQIGRGEVRWLTQTSRILLPAGPQMAASSVTIAGIEAAATGLFLVVAPRLFGSWVLGGELSEPGQALWRLAGIALFSFGLASWPTSGSAADAKSMLRPMQIYNLLATVYLAYLGVRGRSAGFLLWSAVGIHVVLSVLLVHTWLVSDRSAVARTD